MNGDYVLYYFYYNSYIKILSKLLRTLHPPLHRTAPDNPVRNSSAAGLKVSSSSQQPCINAIISSGNASLYVGNILQPRAHSELCNIVNIHSMTRKSTSSHGIFPEKTSHIIIPKSLTDSLQNGHCDRCCWRASPQSSTSRRT